MSLNPYQEQKWKQQVELQKQQLRKRNKTNNLYLQPVCI